jgi:hypothetical protein
VVREARQRRFFENWIERASTLSFSALQGAMEGSPSSISGWRGIQLVIGV